MHMADALLSPAVAGTMYACSAAVMGYSMKKVRFEKDTRKIPVMGVMGAFVFSAQMINFSIPGTGSSGHLCGGMLISALLGPEAGFLSMIGVLLIQCLLFADGGLLALGGNIWNMAFYGCFVGAGLIWRAMMKNGISKKKIIISSILGSVLTLQMGAFSVVMETLLSGITDLPFSAFISAMLPIHLAIGFVEGLITSAVLCFIYEARPEILWLPDRDNSEVVYDKKKRLSFKWIISILAMAAVIMGGLLSLAASSDPDGLEWSIARITGATEVSNAGVFYEIAEKIQNMTAILPDYSLKNSESIAGTSISGIFGGIVVVVLCILISMFLRFLGRKHQNEQN